jgi:hypothetical protein
VQLKPSDTSQQLRGSSGLIKHAGLTAYHQHGKTMIVCRQWR